MPGLLENVMLDVGAHEPWPNDVLLYQPYPIEQILLPDNANCLATQAFLHMCGLPFKVEHRPNAEFMSPSGKVPFIKCGAFLVSELEPIVQFVGNKGISLTEDLDAEQKSDLRAYMSLIFSVLMNAELYICWCDKRTYNEVTKVRNGSVFPWPLNYFQTWSKKSAVTRKLKLHGWHQKTLGSVYQEVENCCQALSERLEGKEFFFGSKPTEIDAFIFGNIFAIFCMSKEFGLLYLIVKKYPNLTNHCNRIHQTYFEKEDVNFTPVKINEANLVYKKEDGKEKNTVENTENKPLSAPKVVEERNFKRQPRALRNSRDIDNVPKKQESRDTTSEQQSLLDNVKSLNSSSFTDIQTTSEIDLPSRKIHNEPLCSGSVSTRNSSRNKLETELTYFNSNLRPLSESTLSYVSDINKNESNTSLTKLNRNSNHENKNNHSQASSDHKMKSNINTSSSIIPESKYKSISIDDTDENVNQSDLDHKIKSVNNTSSSIIPESKYKLISIDDTDDTDQQIETKISSNSSSANSNSESENKNDPSGSSSDHKTKSNNNTSSSIVPDSKYKSISLDDTDETISQSDRHLENKSSSTSADSISESVVEDSNYISISPTKSDDNEFESYESIHRKRRVNKDSATTVESIDSKYDLISLSSSSSVS